MNRKPRCFIYDCQTRRDYQRQSKAVKQIFVELLRVTWKSRISRLSERPPDIETHYVQPENAKQNADVHHVTCHLAKPRKFVD
jgi:hypothetical protein